MRGKDNETLKIIAGLVVLSIIVGVGSVVNLVMAVISLRIPSFEVIGILLTFAPLFLVLLSILFILSFLGIVPRKEFNSYFREVKGLYKL